MESINWQDQYFLEINTNFAKGDISFNEFINKQDSGREWKEMKIMARDTHLLKQFLLKLPIGLRLKAAMYTQDLNFPSVKMMGINGADSYIQLKYPNGKTRGLSRKLMRLALIFDIPFEYVSLPQIINKRNWGLSFFEYNYLCSSMTTIEQIISEKLVKPSVRTIEGFLIDCTDSRIPGLREDSFSVIRLDKQVDFFCLEFYYPCESYFSIGLLHEIGKLIKEEKRLTYIIQTHVLGNLRPCYKICYLGLYDKNPYSQTVLETYHKEILKRTGSKLIYPFF